VEGRGLGGATSSSQLGNDLARDRLIERTQENLLTGVVLANPTNEREERESLPATSASHEVQGALTALRPVDHCLLLRAKCHDYFLQHYNIRLARKLSIGITKFFKF
jgi:hypothetical protein